MTKKLRFTIDLPTGTLRVFEYVDYSHEYHPKESFDSARMTEEEKQEFLNFVDRIKIALKKREKEMERESLIKRLKELDEGEI